MEEYLELWIAFFTCLALFAIYIVYAFVAVPAGGNPFGHALGIIGMSLMLVTETLYALRKRSRRLDWMGPLRIWLSFHIFTGIIGPFLVLLHSAFAVGGLAGFSLIMTGIVVLSGFIGRYIYTAVPHTRAGVELSHTELVARANALQRELDQWLATRPQLAQALVFQTAGASSHETNWVDLFTRAWTDYAYAQHIHTALKQLGANERAQLGKFEQLLQRRHQLERQIAWLGLTHHLLGVWRLVHVPIGATLFTAAIIHVIAVLIFKGV